MCGVGNLIAFDDVLVAGLLLALMTVLAVLCYRAMERPRLVLTDTPEGPRALEGDVIRYAISIPFLTALWIGYFIVILAIARNNLAASDVLVTAAGVVLGTRILAHVWTDAAREIGKVVPLTIVTLVLIAGNIRDDDALEGIIDDLAAIDFALPTYVLIFSLDYVITAVWYWGWIRWGQPLRAARRAARPAGRGRQWWRRDPDPLRSR